MSFEITHILFPTDFSPNAERALSFAAEIAVQTDASLSLLHAVEHTIPIARQSNRNTEQRIKNANKKFDEIIDRLQEEERFQNLSITTILEAGQPVASLLNQAKEHDAGLIVMGTRGATDDRNVLFGSVTTSLIKKAETPILTVPHGSTFNEFKRIIFATDYKEGDWQALNNTIQFAKLFDSTIDILHIEQHENLNAEIRFRGFRDLVTSKTNYSKVNFHLIHENDFFPGAADYLIDHPASLMVMIRYKKTFWEKFLERDHTREMAFYSKIPLLILSGTLKYDNHIDFEEVSKA